MFIQVRKHLFNYRVCIKLCRPLIDFEISPERRHLIKLLPVLNNGDHGYEARIKCAA